jgi:hypothetical protein
VLRPQAQDLTAIRVAEAHFAVPSGAALAARLSAAAGKSTDTMCHTQILPGDQKICPRVPSMTAGICQKQPKQIT